MCCSCLSILEKLRDILENKTPKILASIETVYFFLCSSGSRLGLVHIIVMILFHAPKCRKDGFPTPKFGEGIWRSEPSAAHGKKSLVTSEVMSLL